MIISASRRTDIPRFHSDWFLNRVRAGYVDVRNPLFPGQVSRYSLSPAVVDGIVFWTKDPAPLMERLDELAAYNYYFQFTLTPYGPDIEPGLPDKRQVVATFKELSTRIGPRRVVWRFDPLLVNRDHTVDDHLRAFAELADELEGFTERVVISFIDDYRSDGRSVYTAVGTTGVSRDQQRRLAEGIAAAAREHGMTVATCAESIDLECFGIERGRCVDGRLLEELGACRLSRLKGRYEAVPKDKAQRRECLCAESIDIGWPNTCAHGCRYCYATTDGDTLRRNLAQCDPAGTLLCGTFDPAADKLTDHRGTGDARDRSFKFATDELFPDL